MDGILEHCGTRMLTAALLDGKHDLARWLLEHDVSVDANQDDLNDPSYPRTPLVAAIRTGNISFANAILARGAIVMDHDLAAALYRGEIDLLQRLLHGFVGNAPTALSIAIQQGKPDLFQLILEAGADPTGIPQAIYPEWSQFDGFDPPQSVLEVAAQGRDRVSLQILTQSRLWVPQLIGRALTIAILIKEDETTNDLLNLEADFDQGIEIRHFKEDENGNPVQGWKEIVTPLQAAAREQQVPIAQKLMKRPDVDINYLGEGVLRRTALQYAVANGNLDAVNSLLDHGADINVRPAADRGATALQIAAGQGYLGIARKLLDRGADVNAAPASVNGRTALEAAAEYGRIDMLQMLLNEGAALGGVYGGRQYVRATNLAMENGHTAAATLLQRFRARSQEVQVLPSDYFDQINN